jgi:hypothetical protein
MKQKLLNMTLTEMEWTTALLNGNVFYVALINPHTSDFGLQL